MKISALTILLLPFFLIAQNVPKSVHFIGYSGKLYSTYKNKNGIYFKAELINPCSVYRESVVYASKTQIVCEPQILCDTFSNSFKGRIYVYWSDLKNGKDNEDIFLCFSDDEGINWTEPVLITYAVNHKTQTLPLMKIEPGSGKLVLTYLDATASISNNQFDLMYAESNNGGLKFESVRLNQKAFQKKIKKIDLQLTTNNIPFLQVHEKNIIRKNKYNYLISDSLLLRLKVQYAIKQIILNKTFNCKDSITIRFQAPKAGLLSAGITNPLHSEKEHTIVKKRKIKEGNNSLFIDLKGLGLKKGTYVVNLYYNGTHSYSWLIPE
ncbi:MAG: hypothetical protein IPM51_00710 [Sphingobacteriaceae bacterium]|nr:hypothetical protein [Sphingobacteriaceae bacterium]